MLASTLIPVRGTVEKNWLRLKALLECAAVDIKSGQVGVSDKLTSFPKVH